MYTKLDFPSLATDVAFLHDSAPNYSLAVSAHSRYAGSRLVSREDTRGTTAATALRRIAGFTKAVSGYLH